MESARHARKSTLQTTSHAPHDQRTRTEKDRDRVLYSGFFQRLAGVTQVMTPSLENPGHHSRLMHSYKVGLVAREIALDLLRRCRSDRKLRRALLEWGGLDVSACEAAGLAHDIGHPPFGHAAEGVLDAFLFESPSNDPDGFEGNAQTLRVVAMLDGRKASEPGLDLTAVTTSALLKYPRTRPLRHDQVRGDRYRPQQPPKFSVYRAHVDVLEFARTALPPGIRSDQESLEAGIMDLADDITYAVHDLQDFFQSGLINGQVAAAALRLDYENDREAEHGRELERRYATGSPRFDWAVYREALMTVADWVEVSLGAPFDASPTGVAKLRDAFSGKMSDLLSAVKVAKPNARWAVRPVSLDPPRWHEMMILKYLAKTYIVSTPTVGLHGQSQAQALRTVLLGLDRWAGSAVRDGVEGQLPQPLRNYLRESRGKLDERRQTEQLRDDDVAMLAARARRRAIVDHVCSLTDHECLRMARGLSGQELPG